MAVMALVPLLAACKTPERFLREIDVAKNKELRIAENESALQQAKANFKAGQYGLAEKRYRKAVEKDPKNAEAWLGLAATYDRIKRFDNANQAYDVVVNLVGFTPTVLNNLGYHYYLRGDLRKARKTWSAAHAKDPDNQFINNNLALLDKTPSACSDTNVRAAGHC
jgi:Flp pilus assembly protein TadD